MGRGGLRVAGPPEKVDFLEFSLPHHTPHHLTPIFDVKSQRRFSSAWLQKSLHNTSNPETQGSLWGQKSLILALSNAHIKSKDKSWEGEEKPL